MLIDGRIFHLIDAQSASQDIILFFEDLSSQILSLDMNMSY